MSYEQIKDGGTLLALIIPGSSWPEGLKFYTNENDFVQVASWRYDNGKNLPNHLHKIAKRESNRTQEVVFIRKGSLKSRFYNDDGKFIEEKVLKEGDFVINFAGGHGYEILEDDTQVFEVKNGPYPGLEKDKQLI